MTNPPKSWAAQSVEGQQERAAHTCHARNCDVPVPRSMLMCKRHWFMVPKIIRDQVWRHYIAGQEQGRATPTPEWHAAANAAIAAVAEKEAAHD